MKPIQTRLAGRIALALALLVPAAAPAQHFPPDDDLRTMLRYLVEDGETPGIVLGVLEADGSTRIVSYGSAGREARTLGPRSVFEIGSITKTFTATLLADMVLRGEVSLEDPVAKYLPAHVSVPSRGEREITLLDLATHRSGLPSVPDDLGRIGADDRDVSYTVEDAYAFLSSYQPRHTPGERREYSNFGFGLLGHALARAAGTSYRELVRARILEPLGMERTGFDPSGELAEWLTRGHRGGEPVRYRTDLEIFEGAGALRSNAEDLLRYMKAHVGAPRTDLERAMRLAREIRIPSGGEGGGHGLGWGIVAQPGEAAVVGHGGGTVGFSSHLAFMPDEGIGTVLLANDAGFDDAIALHLLYPDPPPPAWAPVAVGESTLARLAGTYEATSGSGRYYVRLEEDGFLTYQPEGLVRARLYARSDTTFYLLRAPWSFTFRSGGSGEVTMHMEVDAREPAQQGVSRSARKVRADTPPSKGVADNAGAWRGWRKGVWLLLGAGGLLALVLALKLTGRRRASAGEPLAVGGTGR